MSNTREMSAYRKIVDHQDSINRHQKMKRTIILSIIILIALFFIITILVLNKPVLKLKGEKVLEINMGETYQDLGVIATSFGRDVSNEVTTTNDVNMNKAGTYKVCYTISYLNGTIKKYRTVKVVDNKVPVITLKGESVVYLEQNSSYTDAGYEATDNNDGDVTKFVKVDNKIDSSKTGTYQVNYEVSDQAGNRGIATRTVVVVKKTDPNLKTIYLTFDDGPSSITPEILDILKKENVKATFFTIGKSDEYNDTLKRIVAEGHTLALHSNTHNYRYIYSSVDVYFKDLYELRDRLKSITGVTANIMRFPGGASNTVSSFNPGIMSTLTAEVVKRGFYYFDWNVDSGDTGRIGSDAIVKNVTESLGTYHTYVVLMHDYGLNAQTRDALERIIKYGKEHGYRFDRITSETPAVHHGVNN